MKAGRPIEQVSMAGSCSRQLEPGATGRLRISPPRGGEAGVFLLRFPFAAGTWLLPKLKSEHIWPAPSTRLPRESKPLGRLRSTGGQMPEATGKNSEGQFLHWVFPAAAGTEGLPVGKFRDRTCSRGQGTHSCRGRLCRMLQAGCISAPLLPAHSCEVFTHAAAVMSSGLPLVASP